MAKFMITSIDWETDGEEVSLPTEEIVDDAAGLLEFLCSVRPCLRL